MDRMIRAIDEYLIVGVQTTLGFGRFVMQHEAFRTGDFDTHFVPKYFTPDRLERELDEDQQRAGAAIAALVQQGGKGTAVPSGESTVSGSKSPSTWRIRRGATS